MKMKAKEIARLLGVSPSTVSLVLNNKPGVGEETRQQILKLLKENNYNVPDIPTEHVPERHIQFIIYKKHGKVISDTPFFSVLIESINRAARTADFNLIITYVDENQDDIPSILVQIDKTRPAGLLILATEMASEDINNFKYLGCPMLLLDNQFADQDIDTVCINNADGVYKAVSYLVSLQHKEIGYLDSKVWINNFEQRLRYFKYHLLKYGAVLPEGNIFQLTPTMDGAYLDMKTYLSLGKDMPSALFAANDIIALGASRALKEAGYQIPQDISIVGFDDIAFCEMSDPPLTTIHVYNQHMGSVAVKRLVELIEQPSIEIQKTYISTHLILRSSTRSQIGQ